MITKVITESDIHFVTGSTISIDTGIHPNMLTLNPRQWADNFAVMRHDMAIFGNGHMDANGSVLDPRTVVV